MAMKAGEACTECMREPTSGTIADGMQRMQHMQMDDAGSVPGMNWATVDELGGISNSVNN